MGGEGFCSCSLVLFLTQSWLDRGRDESEGVVGEERIRQINYHKLSWWKKPGNQQCLEIGRFQCKSKRVGLEFQAPGTSYESQSLMPEFREAGEPLPFQLILVLFKQEAKRVIISTSTREIELCSLSLWIQSMISFRNSLSKIIEGWFSRYMRIT